ncbi:MAG TPA: hypothetical protein VLC53_20420 [Myxococcota bacterium]|nr:hypothetical protein [Myxococcota bacterium]
MRLHRAAEAHLAAHPDFADFLAPLRPVIAAGLAAPLTDPEPPALDFLLQIPR